MEKSERQWVQTLENKVTQLEAKIACLKNEITARDYELRREIEQRRGIKGVYSDDEKEVILQYIDVNIRHLAKRLDRTENSVAWQMRRTIIEETGKRRYEGK